MNEYEACAQRCTTHHQRRTAAASQLQCGQCAYQCSLISGTMFESSKLLLSLWFVGPQLLTQAKNKVSTLELMRQRAATTSW